MIQEIDIRRDGAKCFLVHYGFRLCHVFPTSLPKLTLIALGHLHKLTLPCTPMRRFRLEALEAIEKLNPTPPELITPLRDLLSESEEELEQRPVKQRWTEEAFVGMVERAYECLYQAEERSLARWMKDANRTRVENALLQDLRIRLLTFKDDCNPEHSPGDYRAIYVNVYQSDSFQAVLMHSSELTRCSNFSFPFIYDCKELPDLGRKQVLAGLLESAMRFVRQIGPEKAKYTAKMTPRSTAKLIGTAEALQEKSVFREDLLYTNVLCSLLPTDCDICHGNKRGCKRLECLKHNACNSDYNNGNCRICKSSEEMKDDIKPPQCDICRRDSRPFPVIRVSECSCLCTSCWKAYLQTYVLIPETVHCPGRCGVDIRRDVIIQKFGIVLRTCSACKGQTVYVKHLACECVHCFSCEINLRGSDISKPCTTCKEIVCCNNLGTTLSVTNFQPCGHRTHNSCKRRYENKCPRCHPPNHA